MSHLRLAAVALLALLAALPSPAASAAARRPCAAMVEAIDRSAQAVLFWGRQRRGEHRALCARYRTERGTRTGSRSSLGASRDAGKRQGRRGASTVTEYVLVYAKDKKRGPV